jgi:uncharacterized protein (DUF1015 family)
MAALFPFRALRPAGAVAARVAAVPYDVVNTEEARALASDPLSFLHVSRAEIDLPGTDPHAEEVYQRAAANFVSLRTAAPLTQEAQPSLYVYRLRMGDHVQTGVAGLFSLPEYEQGVIRRHELTRKDKEDDRTRHILALRAQTGPVLLTYPASSAVDALVDRALAVTEPLYDFTAADGVTHTMWRFDDEATGWQMLEAFAAVPALYIADGHHRAASAARAWKENGTDGFLAVAFPGNQMQILPYNRTVKDLHGLSPEALLAAIRQRFTVSAGPASPAEAGHVSMFLDGSWFTVDLGAPDHELPAAERLDVSRLQQHVLAPLLGVGDPRTDGRIEFVGGGRGTTELERLVGSGRAAVAFAMHPVSVDDLMAISDAGGIMPPKSTWFEPKLRDGLLVHLI